MKCLPLSIRYPSRQTNWLVHAWSWHLQRFAVALRAVKVHEFVSKISLGWLRGQCHCMFNRLLVQPLATPACFVCLL